MLGNLQDNYVEVLFWVCALLVAYPYAIYPLLLVGINRLGRRPVHAADRKSVV